MQDREKESRLSNCDEDETKTQLTNNVGDYWLHNQCSEFSRSVNRGLGLKKLKRNKNLLERF